MHLLFSQYANIVIRTKLHNLCRIVSQSYLTILYSFNRLNPLIVSPALQCLCEVKDNTRKSYEAMKSIARANLQLVGDIDLCRTKGVEREKCGPQELLFQEEERERMGERLISSVCNVRLPKNSLSIPPNSLKIHSALLLRAQTAETGSPFCSQDKKTKLWTLFALYEPHYHKGLTVKQQSTNKNPTRLGAIWF